MNSSGETLILKGGQNLTVTAGSGNTVTLGNGKEKVARIEGEGDNSSRPIRAAVIDRGSGLHRLVDKPNR